MHWYWRGWTGGSHAELYSEMSTPWHDVVAIRTGSEQSHVVRQTECLGDMKSPLAKNYMPIHAHAARRTYRHVPLTGDRNQWWINFRNLSKFDSDWISRPKKKNTTKTHLYNTSHKEVWWHRWISSRRIDWLVCILNKWIYAGRYPRVLLRLVCHDGRLKQNALSNSLWISRVYLLLPFFLCRRTYDMARVTASRSKIRGYDFFDIADCYRACDSTGSRSTILVTVDATWQFNIYWINPIFIM